MWAARKSNPVDQVVNARITMGRSTAPAQRQQIEMLSIVIVISQGVRRRAPASTRAESGAPLPPCRCRSSRASPARSRSSGAALSNGATSLLRLLQLLEPVFDDDQLVACAGLQWANEQEAPVVRCHGVLRVKSVGCEFRGRKQYRGVAEREPGTGTYRYRHEIPRAVAIEQLAPAMRPHWLRSSGCRNRPLCRACVWKRDHVDLVLAGLVRDVRQPSSVGGKGWRDFGEAGRYNGHWHSIDSWPDRENVTCTGRLHVGL